MRPSPASSSHRLDLLSSWNSERVGVARRGPRPHCSSPRPRPGVGGQGVWGSGARGSREAERCGVLPAGVAEGVGAALPGETPQRGPTLPETDGRLGGAGGGAGSSPPCPSPPPRPRSVSHPLPPFLSLGLWGHRAHSYEAQEALAGDRPRSVWRERSASLCHGEARPRVFQPKRPDTAQRPLLHSRRGPEGEEPRAGGAGGEGSRQSPPLLNDLCLRNLPALCRGLAFDHDSPPPRRCSTFQAGERQTGLKTAGRTFSGSPARPGGGGPPRPQAAGLGGRSGPRCTPEPLHPPLLHPRSPVTARGPRSRALLQQRAEAFRPWPRASSRSLGSAWWPEAAVTTHALSPPSCPLVCVVGLGF